MTEDKKPFEPTAQQKAELAKFIKFHLGHYGPRDLKNLFPAINIKKVKSK